MHHGVTFNFGSVKVVHLPYLRGVSLMTDIWVAATDYYMYF